MITLFRWGYVVAALGLSWTVPALAEKTPDYDRMLDSVVRVECLVSLDSEPIMTGQGSGFLISHGEVVITNSHVVDECHPNNKLKVLKSMWTDQLWADVKAGKTSGIMEVVKQLLAQDPDYIRRWQTDEKFRSAVVNKAVDMYAEAKGRQMLPHLGQELRLMVPIKGSKDATPIAISQILYSAWNDAPNNNERQMDMAVIRLAQPLTQKTNVTGFASGEALHVGDDVMTVGFPGGSSLVKDNQYEPTLKKGTISKVGGGWPVPEEISKRGVKGVPVIETDAAINHGNSGGPMFNDSGEVIGINTWAPGESQHVQGIYWAQEIGETLAILKQLNIAFPEARTKPRSWFSQNIAIVAVLVLLMAGIGGFFWWRKRKPTASASRQRAMIKGVSGEYQNKAVKIGANGVVLGRDPSRAGLVFSTPEVSGSHCRIEFENGLGKFKVTDLQSSNGTFMQNSGERLKANLTQHLEPGSVIRLGTGQQLMLVVE